MIGSDTEREMRHRMAARLQGIRIFLWGDVDRNVGFLTANQKLLGAHYE